MQGANVQSLLTYKRVATGYGQPTSTFYDWTLTQAGAVEEGFRLPPGTEGRLLIERFSNKVTNALYSNDSDPVGLAKDSERLVLAKFLARDYDQLEQKHQQYETSRMSSNFPLLQSRLQDLASALREGVHHYRALCLSRFRFFC